MRPLSPPRPLSRVAEGLILAAGGLSPLLREGLLLPGFLGGGGLGSSCRILLGGRLCLQEVLRFSERVRRWGWLHRGAEPAPGPPAIGTDPAFGRWGKTGQGPVRSTALLEDCKKPIWKRRERVS